MSESGLAELVARLRDLPGLLHKSDIQGPAAVFPHQPFPQLGPAGALGDDAALIPAVEAPLLLACEAMSPELVAQDPWFAGWSGVLVNLSDIAAMGGIPLALVDSLWCRERSHGERLLEGMRFAAETFAVPVVGGHTNLHSPYDALSVAVLGVAPSRVLSARFARPGDRCALLINRNGSFHRPYPFWDAATRAEPGRLRAHLALLPQLAAAGVVHAAKDISMGGLVGTAAMFAEAAGCRLRLDLEAIEPPEGVDLEAWLTCFPSYGYLLAVTPARIEALQAAVAAHGDLSCHGIGEFEAGQGVRLRQGETCSDLWSDLPPLTGFGALG